MTHQHHLTSIIIPCYNAETWISECLDSVIAQTYRPLEVIVIDDGSTDSSLKIIQRCATQYPDLIRYESTSNRGACTARNTGFRTSRGEYVMFLDADDVIEPTAIAELVYALHNTDYGIAACNWRYLRHSRDKLAVFGAPRSPKNLNDIERELAGYYNPLGSLLFTQTAVTSVGGWDESLSAFQDVDLKLRCLLQGIKLVRINQIGFFYRLHDGISVSKQTSEASFRSQLTVLQKTEGLMSQAEVLHCYSLLLAKSYYGLSKRSLPFYPSLAYECLHYAEQLDPDRTFLREGTWTHRLFTTVIGAKRKEQLAAFLAKHGLGRSVRRAYLSD